PRHHRGPAGAVQAAVDGRHRGADRSPLPPRADDVLRGARPEAPALRRLALFATLAVARIASAADAPPAATPQATPDAGAAVDPDAPTVAARVDRAQVHVGDPIHVSVVTIAKATVPVNLPGTLELGPLTLLDRKEGEQNLGDGRIRREFTLTVAAYEPGEIAVPAIDVTYLGPRGDMRTARTAPVPVKIASLIANEPEPALK